MSEPLDLNELNRTIDTLSDDSGSFVDDIGANTSVDNEVQKPHTETDRSTQADGSTTKGHAYLDLIAASSLDQTHITELIALARIEQDQEHERRLKKLEYEHLERLRELDDSLRIKEMEHERMMRELEEDARKTTLEHQRVLAELGSDEAEADSLFAFSASEPQS